VYRARDTRLGRTVAIKILPTELSSDPARRQRFQREAKIISSLNHPHICVVHDIGSQDGLDFLVMEFLVKNPAYSWQKTSGCPRFESIRCPPDFCSIPRVDWPSGEAEAQVGTVLRASIYAVLVLVIYHAVRGRRARA
jgi:serine/threonine protein kinase